MKVWNPSFRKWNRPYDCYSGGKLQRTGQSRLKVEREGGREWGLKEGRRRPKVGRMCGFSHLGHSRLSKGGFGDEMEMRSSGLDVVKFQLL